MTQSVLNTRTNPHGAAFSSYAESRDGRLVQSASPVSPLTGEALDAHDAFRDHVMNTEFPCVAAKAAINKNHYRYGFYPEVNSSETTEGLAHDLWNYARDQPAFDSDYATFIACFRSPKVMDEAAWEKLLWGQVQSLHIIDRSDWDAEVSSNPADDHFSFSFAGTGFFIVGLHNGATRLSRRFAWPTMVFNVHAQFERLREAGKFERMKETIRTRDLSLQGTLNPNLSDYGKTSEARQYSGRPVENGWQCPFKRIFDRKSKPQG